MALPLAFKKYLSIVCHPLRLKFWTSELRKQKSRKFQRYTINYKLKFLFT